MDTNQMPPEMKTISGFSKLSKRGKIKWIVENFFKDPENVMRELMSYWVQNEEQQKVLDGFSENTISNFVLPYGVAPNFLINGQMHCIPMVIEESSVVAAASHAAKFWMNRGGFQAEVISMVKEGQVHFIWPGNPSILHELFPQLRKELIEKTGYLTENMRQRGGGILDVELLDLTDKEPGYYQLRGKFDTRDSMGANFINTLLEEFSQHLKLFMSQQSQLPEAWQEVEVIMSILSNYTPECLVRASVSCPVRELDQAIKDMDGETFARRFYLAVKMAQWDPYRATTHNKGIFNGVDAVVLATGNDFRATEACGHTYASRHGKYASLSDCSIEQGTFQFWLEMPLAIGTTGGLTSLHPMAKRSLELLGNPNAEQLMQIIAATGLAQNFAAVKSLVTTGIQKGHMKMHLVNILTRMDASEREIKEAIVYFKDKVVSFQSVREFLDVIRNNPPENQQILA